MTTSERPRRVSAREQFEPREHIGINFKPWGLYAPIPSGTETTIIHTLLKEVDPADFYLTLNGGPPPGPLEGILFRMHEDGSGFLNVNSLFAHYYTGEWPAVLNVVYAKNGIDLDLGRLQVRDLRTAIAHHIQADFRRVVSIPPPGEIETVHVFVTLLDDGRIPLPFAREDWDVHLDNPPQGVSVSGNFIYVSHEAPPGDVQVRITARDDLEEAYTMTLIPMVLP